MITTKEDSKGTIFGVISQAPSPLKTDTMDMIHPTEL